MGRFSFNELYGASIKDIKTSDVVIILCMGKEVLIYAPEKRLDFMTYRPSDILGRPLNATEEKNAPARLYAAGRLQIPLQNPRVSIIGTREPSFDGLSKAYEIAGELARRGIIIVSGLARGIDTSAHKGAIDAGGKTIAVLGTPLDQFYPYQNMALQKKIMREHLAITEFPIGYKVRPKNFVMRDRTMALLSDASIIIEAGDSSGTLYQGWETLRLGRPLFIWKKVFENGGLHWPEEMLKYGAIKLEDINQIIDEISFGAPVFEIRT